MRHAAETLKSPALGIGIAYGTENLEHLLNVSASEMSARPDDPDHFLDWLKTQTRWRPVFGI
ncbi:FAD/NAD(P)-binding protein [Paracoccus caeni]|uniref:FAD/NAD(P)-binding protein n=1 Tax=Paracoccus caeni TaxID=657651 RepID=A0A934W1D6_9RHOB|nr:FAD/NAD(P)-binding protein [Paracoccus caeni]MBK4216704.1 FAD/NAD(P)-binding protein [Paracoccus caeni]